MLSRNKRITKERDWRAIHRRGRSVYASVLGVKFQNNNQVFSRFGFMVGIKVAKKANRRNLIKRRLRAIVRSHLEKIKRGYDIIFITKLGIAELAYKELEKEALSILKRSNLLG